MPPKQKYSIKANGGNGFFRTRPGERKVQFSYQVWNSPAFATLSFSARLVLIDWIRFYFEASSWESQDLTDIGFEYTFAVCHVEGLNENTFLLARKEIAAHGFFSAPPELQSGRVCSATIFIPSSEWKRYKLTAEELAEQKRSETVRTKRLERGRRNRRQVLARLCQRPQSNQAPKNGDALSTKNRDIR